VDDYAIAIIVMQFVGWRAGAPSGWQGGRGTRRRGGANVIVEVVGGADEVPGVRVADVDDLTRLHLAVGAVTDDEVDAALRKDGLGRLVDADNGVLDVAALRAAAEPRATSASWGQDFDAMVAAAADTGWAADDGASLRVHVEPAASA
jgi:hypothetical protein